MKSPLTEVQVESLETYFNLDPLDMQDSDLDKIVEALRAQRKNFLIKEAASAKRGKTPAPPNMKLEDLDL